jgi:hypothetical protein
LERAGTSSLANQTVPFYNGSDSFEGEKSASRQKATSVCKVQITKSNTQEVAMQTILQALLAKMGSLANRNKSFC